MRKVQNFNEIKEKKETIKVCGHHGKSNCNGINDTRRRC